MNQAVFAFVVQFNCNIKLKCTVYLHIDISIGRNDQRNDQLLTHLRPEAIFSMIGKNVTTFLLIGLKT